MKIILCSLYYRVHKNKQDMFIFTLCLTSIRDTVGPELNQLYDFIEKTLLKVKETKKTSQ